MIRLTDREVLVTRTIDGKRVQTIETHPKPRPLMDVLGEHVAKVQAERDRRPCPACHLRVASTHTPDGAECLTIQAEREALEDQRDRDELARERDREWWAE